MRQAKKKSYPYLRALKPKKPAKPLKRYAIDETSKRVYASSKIHAVSTFHEMGYVVTYPEVREMGK